MQEETPEPALGDAFKAVFRHHPAAVALITARTPQGLVGLTASSVGSVAADPPSISFSVTRATGSAGGLLGADAVQVHLLSDADVEVARAFAVSGAPRFTAEQGWTFDEHDEPVLPGARASLCCRILDTLRVGSSSLVVAEVLAIRLGPEGAPLLYHDRRFHRFSPDLSPLP